MNEDPYPSRVNRLSRSEQQLLILVIAVGWVIAPLMALFGFSGTAIWLRLTGQVWLERNDAVSYWVLVYAGMSLSQFIGALLSTMIDPRLRAPSLTHGKRVGTGDKKAKSSVGVWVTGAIYVLANMILLPGYYQYPENSPESWGTDLLLVMLFPMVFILAPLVFYIAWTIHLMQIKNKDGRYVEFNCLAVLIFTTWIGAFIFPLSFVMILPSLLIGIWLLVKFKRRKST